VVRVWDGIYVDGVMIRGRMVCEVDDGRRACRHCCNVESVEDTGVGPHKTRWNAEDREGGGEERGERGGDWNGREVEGGGVNGGESA